MVWGYLDMDRHICLSGFKIVVSAMLVSWEYKSISQGKSLYTLSAGYRIQWLHPLQEGKTIPKVFLWYDTKLHLVVKLLFLSSSLPLLPIGVAVPVRVSTMGQIDASKLFASDRNTWCLIIVCKLFVLRIFTWSYNWDDYYLWLKTI